MTLFRYIVVFETRPSGWVTGKARFASRSGMRDPLCRLRNNNGRPTASARKSESIFGKPDASIQRVRAPVLSSVTNSAAANALGLGLGFPVRDELLRDEPAAERPERAGAPAGEHIRRIMNTEI